VWSRIRPRCATLLGKSIAVAFSNFRSPREYEFATDRFMDGDYMAFSQLRLSVTDMGFQLSDMCYDAIHVRCLSAG